ncbi:ALG14, UDP-N-acetylglucosaminyltransferase subunit [Lycorma delicatula]|uniref:ALG14, UDP-N-acetylglucosaminyltransferase subunit n=1 Tax=Lycorma delicatula TaxID=130591 RepID=UPI003F5183AC
MYLTVLLIVLTALYLVLARTTVVMYQVIFETRIRKKKRSKTDSVKTAIVIGSGGHTTEMLMLVKCLDPRRYSPRTYIMSETDSWSERRIEMVENNFGIDESCKRFEIVKIPRSREVHQSYFTSIFSTLYSIYYCIPVFYKINPDLVICNGPGTCLPICLIGFMMRVFFLSDNRIVFIESICRVKTLSLTGKILLFFADEILVQWPDLQQTYPRTKYIGRL